MIRCSDARYALQHKGYTDAEIDAMSDADARAIFAADTSPKPRRLSEIEIARIVAKKQRERRAAKRAGTLIVAYVPKHS
jgi:hypothetical protein